MFTGDLGRVIENVALVAFVVANFAVPFVALWWGLGRAEEPAAREHADRGAMTAGGLPYVPGPPRT